MSKNKFQALSWFAGVAIAILTAGTIMAWWSLRTLSPVPDATPSPQTTSTTIPQQKTEIQIYWLSDTGTNVQVVARPFSVDSRLTPEEKLKAAFFEQLVGSTPPPSLSSAIPSGTKVLGLDVKPEGVFVDLSHEFTSGGGSASMIGRLAQVFYTASSLDPQVPVWISVEGKPLEILGEEGLMVDQPMTRQAIEQEFLSP